MNVFEWPSQIPENLWGDLKDCEQEMPSQFNRSGNYFCKEEVLDVPC